MNVKSEGEATVMCMEMIGGGGGDGGGGGSMSMRKPKGSDEND